MIQASPAFELADVGFRYPDGLLALDHVNLRVEQGEIVALVGPSGCGKSTILNIVSGLRQPSRGRVTVHGKSDAKRRGCCSYMPQRDCLLPWRTALDNATLLREVQGASRSEARDEARQMLSRFDLDGFAGRLPSQLSGGMRQRIALIRTFLPGRDVLLDEPFGALDAITRGELQEWLLGLQAQTRSTILLVTHDLDEAIFVADRIYLLSPRPGRVAAETEVRLPRPRSLGITASEEFMGIKADLMRCLRSSTRAGVAA